MKCAHFLMLGKQFHQHYFKNSYKLRNEQTVLILSSLLYTRISFKGKYLTVNIKQGSRGSSVSIVSDYGLDDQAIEFRSRAEAKGFFLQPLCPHQV
jgi:hypothetical protein